MKLGLCFFCALAAFAQPRFPKPQSATVTLTNTPTAEAVKQMSTVVKVVAAVTDVTFDPANLAFSMKAVSRAPENQLNLAAWLLHAMDNPAGWQPPQPGSREAEYQLQPSGDPFDDGAPVTRVRYLRNSDFRDVNEIVTVIHLLDFSSGQPFLRVVPCNLPPMIVFRGSAAQADLADWLIEKLDLPATSDTSALRSGVNDYTLPPHPDGTDDIVRVFYLNPATSRSSGYDLREKIRQTVSGIALFNKIAPPAIVIRGSSTLLAQARQIIDSSGQ